MPSYLARIILCLSSYAPLFFIFAVTKFDVKAPFVSIALFVLGALSIAAVLYFFFVWAQRCASRPEHAMAAQIKDSELMSYLITYVFPFITTNVSGYKDGVGLLIFYSMLW